MNGNVSKTDPATTDRLIDLRRIAIPINTSKFKKPSRVETLDQSSGRFGTQSHFWEVGIGPTEQWQTY